MLYEYGKRTREFLGHFYFYFSFLCFGSVFIETIFHLYLLVRYVCDDFNQLSAMCLVDYLSSYVHGMLVEIVVKYRVVFNKSCITKIKLNYLNYYTLNPLTLF